MLNCGTEYVFKHMEKKELIYLVQLRHLRELGSVPVPAGKAQPDPGEVTLDGFYLIFSSPHCWALSKHQAPLV